MAGTVVAIKTVGFVVRRTVRFAGHEAQARGSDVTFVLGAAERGRARVRP